MMGLNDWNEIVDPENRIATGQMNDRREGYTKPTHIVIHITGVDDFSAVKKRFVSGGASAHYLIKKDGVIVQFVPELGMACYEGNVGKVKRLIEQGASFEKGISDEVYIYDILYTALAFNQIDVVKLILNEKYYESVNKLYSEDAETPLTMACSLSDRERAVEISKEMIALGAKVNGAGYVGGDYTKYPLIIAVSQNNSALVSLLVENGANTDITDISGDTPLTIAKNRGYKQISEFLR